MTALTQADIEKLEGFLERIKKDTYPEQPTQLHNNITNLMFEHCLRKFALPSNSRVLDVGCGQGLALRLFAALDLKPIGVSLNHEDIIVCREQGYEVYEMDQSFLTFPDGEFDFIWCRHCLEHSVFPYFTLSEFFRVLKPKAYLYVEVPAPDTTCAHQTNRNHYSVLGKSMWMNLIRRSGFDLIEDLDINFEDAPGGDTYWAFIQQKP
jgi:SAM-dependent methyltransferase